MKSSLMWTTPTPPIRVNYNGMTISMTLNNQTFNVYVVDEDTFAYAPGSNDLIIVEKAPIKYGEILEFIKQNREEFEIFRIAHAIKSLEV